MKAKSKFLISMMIVLVIALPLMNVALAVEAGDGGSNEESSPLWRKRLTRLMRSLQIKQRKAADVRQFFRGAEAVTVEGTVVTAFRNILIIDLNGERLNIRLPQFWSVNTEVINVSQMFEGTLQLKRQSQ